MFSNMDTKVVSLSQMSRIFFQAVLVNNSATESLPSGPRVGRRASPRDGTRPPPPTDSPQNLYVGKMLYLTPLLIGV